MVINIQEIAEAARASPRAQDRPKAERVYNPAAEQRQAAQQRYGVYKEYQANIRKSGMLRTDIIKGAAAGEDTMTLLIMACKCIGCMTGDGAFSDIVCKRLAENGGSHERKVT